MFINLLTWGDDISPKVDIPLIHIWYSPFCKKKKKKTTRNYQFIERRCMHSNCYFGLYFHSGVRILRSIVPYLKNLLKEEWMPVFLMRNAGESSWIVKPDINSIAKGKKTESMQQIVRWPLPAFELFLRMCLWQVCTCFIYLLDFYSTPLAARQSSG